MQDVFAIITAVYGMLSFTHYAFRSYKLFRSKTSPKWRPVGWTKWGMVSSMVSMQLCGILNKSQLEFLQINVLIVITLVEIELVAGTAPNNPIVRLCAMPSPTICFYLGFLFCSTAILTQLGWKLPFNMSSTPKGTPWRPALFGFIEDAGAIEGQGGVEYRKKLIKRYEMSPRFRRMILILSWAWGLGLLLVATIATVLIMVIETDVGFGVGWGLPYMFSAVYVYITVKFVRSQLAKERAEWGSKETPSGARVV
jgi:hypothetical protein